MAPKKAAPSARAGSPSARGKKKTKKSARKKVKAGPNYTGTVYKLQLNKERQDTVFGVAMNSDATTGVVVTGVTPGGLCDRAGLRESDVIYKVNDVQVLYAVHTTELLRAAEVGIIHLEVLRNEDEGEDEAAAPDGASEAAPEGAEEVSEVAELSTDAAAEEGEDPVMAAARVQIRQASRKLLDAKQPAGSAEPAAAVDVSDAAAPAVAAEPPAPADAAGAEADAALEAARAEAALQIRQASRKMLEVKLSETAAA